MSDVSAQDRRWLDNTVAVPSEGDYGVGDRLNIGVDQHARSAARMLETLAAKN